MIELGDIRGRTCPLDYACDVADLALLPPEHAEVLYVVGGLYGNFQALEAVQECARAESVQASFVFNGDFNWFNVDGPGFVKVNERVLELGATRGNVETELARDTDFGCGCGYPEWVEQSVVDHANAIMRRLKDTARAFPLVAKSLAALPMQRVYEVAGRRVAVVHGDAESLAGWRFSRRCLSQAAGRERIRQWFDAAEVDVFASSHTCTPVLARLALADRTGIVVNNGAAGMPNFYRPRGGLITRLASRPATDVETLYGTRLGSLFVDALVVDYDRPAWQEAFAKNWPAGSAAHKSYWQRLLHGVDETVANALIL